MSRWLRALLVVSLVLNLLVVGFVGGLVIRGGPHPFMPPMLMAHVGMPRMGASWLVSELPQARQEQLRPVLRRTFTNMRPHLRAMHEAQKNLEQALTRPQLDRAELQRALAAMQSHMRKVDLVGQNGLLEIAVRLSFDERKQLARTLRSPPWRRHNGHRRMHADTDRGK